MSLKYLSLMTLAAGAGIGCGILPVAAEDITAYSEIIQSENDLVANTVREATVRGRKRPAYDPIGLHAGSHFLYPFIDASVAYDDNVYATENNEKGDLYAKNTGAMLAQSDWGRHMLNFQIGVTDRRYRTLTRQNFTNLFASTEWRYDVARDFNIGGTASAARLHELPGTGDAPINAAEPVPYEQYDASLSFNKRFNRLIVQWGGAVQHFNYHDVTSLTGMTIDEDARDGTIYTGVLKKSYEFSPGYRIFGFVEANKRNFKGDNVSGARDSKGFQGRAGVEFELTRVVAGEISVGYLYQNYDAADLKDVSGLAAKGGLLWNPTQLMTVTLNGERRVAETTYPGASSRLETIVLAQIDYEILRNLIGSPHVKYMIEDYQGVSRNDEIVEVGVSFDYLINRTFSLGAAYTYTNKDSNIEAAEYDKSLVVGTLNIQF